MNRRSGMWRSGCGLGCGLCLMAAAAGGCAKAQARSNPDGPPLEVPQPPPRLIVAMEEPIPAAPIEEAAAPTPTPPRPAIPPAARPVARPEPKPEPTAVPAAVDTRQAEPRTLRAPGENPNERGIRDRLTIASRDLARVDYGRLSAAARTQYDQSKRFIQQAEQAIKEQNFVFAATLADKAATLASDLLGR